MIENTTEDVTVLEQSIIENLSVKERVNKIVKKRQELREEYKTTFEKISRWGKLRDIINGFRNNAIWNNLIQSDKELKRLWSDLEKDIDVFSLEIDQLVNEKQTGDFDEAYARVKRSWLNIGLVGPWRYGKSITISQLTGLDSYIVPLSQHAKCTGTTIDIINGEDKFASENLDNKFLLNDIELNITSSQDKANIYFYSLREMCQLMNGYIQKIGKPFMFKECNTIEEFEAECLRVRKLEEYKLSVSGEERESNEIFKEYIEHAKDYAKYLTGKVGVIVELQKNKGTYRPFVSFLAKPDNEYRLNNGETPVVVYTVLAVKKAEVYTSFKLCGEEVGEIHIVDNPGYGEARIGVYDALENALKKDLDIAIALFRTAEGFEPKLAQEFHKLLLKAVNGRNAQDWLFYLFNLWKINRLKNTSVISTAREGILKDLGTPFTDGIHEIAGLNLSYDIKELHERGMSEHIAHIDCLNEPQNLQQFFYEILDVMSSSIVRVDEVFFSSVKKQIKETDLLYCKIVEDINNINKQLPTDYKDHVRELLNRVYSSLSLVFPSNPITDLAPIVDPIKIVCKENDSKIGNESVLLQILSENEMTSFSKDISDNKPDEDITEEELAQREEDVENILINRKINVLKPLVSRTINNFEFKTHQEFIHYTELKIKIKENFESKFTQIINTSDVDRSIMTLKNRIIQIFMKEGRLNFITDDETEWLKLFIQFLSNGGKVYSSLILPFEDFDKRNISVEHSILDNIKTTIQSCLNINSFRVAYFDDYETTCTELAYSLYRIEMAIKERLFFEFTEPRQIDKFTSPIYDKFYGPLKDFLKLIFAKGKSVGQQHWEYDALMQFYLDHFEKIADPEFKSLQATISNWNTEISNLIYSAN